MSKNKWLNWYKDKIDLTGAPPISDRKIKAISLFTGIAGIDMAMELCNIETVAFCDNAPYSHLILIKHWNAYVFDEKNHDNNIEHIEAGKIPIFTDITTLTEELLERAKIQPKEIECIHGGFCCQPYSVMGQRRADKDERHLYPAMVKLISTIKPRIVFGENVVGFKSLGIDGLSADLDAAGYDIRSFTLPALGQNAPHPRYRVLITGFARDYQTKNSQSNNNQHGTIKEFINASNEEISRSNTDGTGGMDRNNETLESVEGRDLPSNSVSAGLDKNDEEEQFRWVQPNLRNYNGRDIFEPGLSRVRSGNARFLSNNYKESIKALGNMVNILQVYPIIRYLRYVDDLCMAGDSRIEAYEDRLQRAQSFVENLRDPLLSRIKDKFAMYEGDLYVKAKCNPALCREYNPFKIESLDKYVLTCNHEKGKELWLKANYHNIYKTNKTFADLVIGKRNAMNYTYYKDYIDCVWQSLVDSGKLESDEPIGDIMSNKFSVGCSGEISNR